MIILSSLESDYVQFLHTIYQPTIPKNREDRLACNTNKQNDYKIATSKIPVPFFAFFAAAPFAAAIHHSSE